MAPAPDIMLAYLRVHNLAVLRDIEVGFEPGLNVLTGETGAGKSLLVGAVGLLLGDRADQGLVRRQGDAAVVEGQFLPVAPAVAAEMDGQGLPPADESGLLVRREIRSPGANRAFVNGSLVPLAVLRQLLSRQVALHGQHRHLRLVSAAACRELVDAAGVEAPQLDRLKQSWQGFTAAWEKCCQHERSAADAATRLEFLRFQLREIEAARPQAGEDLALENEARLLASAAERLALSETLVSRLLDAEDAIAARLVRCGGDLERLAALDPRLSSEAERLREAAYLVEDVAGAVRQSGDGGDESDGGRLEEVQERLASLQALKRRFGGDLDQVLAQGCALRQEVEDLSDLGATRERLQAAAARAGAAFHRLATAVGEARREAAGRVARGVQKELKNLALKSARFGIRVDGRGPQAATDSEAVREHGGPSGYDEVQFLFAANPGDEMRDVARVASGGELSRLMLALHLAASGGPPTSIFDEVDAGIGGETATVVGERLRRAARGHQVICVTHLPQIAAMADHHLGIAKAVSRGRAATTVQALGKDERVEEVARMLGTETSPATALRHAAAMLGTDGGSSRGRRATARRPGGQATAS